MIRCKVSERVQRGMEVGVDWRVTHTIFFKNNFNVLTSQSSTLTLMQLSTVSSDFVEINIHLIQERQEKEVKFPLLVLCGGDFVSGPEQQQQQDEFG